GFEGHFKTLRSRGEYYIVRNQIRNIVVINKNNFKGIVIKGRYNFDYFSLHPLLEKRVGRGYTIAKNNGPATEYNPYFTPGEKLEVRGKSVDTNSYYWQPRERLPKGEYVAWIGTSFWIFKIE
ncbi:MAG: hypothetical protein GWP19_15615, partial [Planctomycetia bacterium]|nr:hypothetical protein [Planctomycetia bacterium]